MSRGLITALILAFLTVNASTATAGGVLFDFYSGSYAGEIPPSNLTNHSYAQDGITLAISNFVLNGVYNPGPFPGFNDIDLYHYPYTVGSNPGYIEFSKNMTLNNIIIGVVDGKPLVFSLRDANGNTVATYSTNGYSSISPTTHPEFRSILFSSTGSNDYYIDKLNASPVPIPGVVWLLGSGVIGLAGARKRLGLS